MEELVGTSKPQSSYESAQGDPNKLYDEEKYVEAFGLYLGLANAGHADHQVMVGWMYQEGIGVEKNLENAFTWYSAAAEVGSDAGQYHLGSLYAIKKDYEKAKFWYEKSASQGYMPGLYRLGWAYEKGRGVPVDQNTAFALFEKSAQKGHLPSQRIIAKKLISGRCGFWKRIKGIFLFCKVLSGVLWIPISDSESDRIRW